MIKQYMSIQEISDKYGLINFHRIQSDGIVYTNNDDSIRIYKILDEDNEYLVYDNNKDEQTIY